MNPLDRAHRRDFLAKTAFVIAGVTGAIALAAVAVAIGVAPWI